MLQDDDLDMLLSKFGNSRSNSKSFWIIKTYTDVIMTGVARVMCALG